jgi:serine/threonine protein kinase
MLELGRPFANRFDVVASLGVGGMGFVYRVKDRDMGGSDCALKVMHPELLKEESYRKRFEQEACVGANIKSDHLVKVFHKGIDATTGIPWFTMELLEGDSLASRVDPDRRLSMAETLVVFKQLGHALRLAHQQGLVHCDLKPDNIFIAKPLSPECSDASCCSSG